MKVRPFNKNLLKDYFSLLSVISIPFGFFSIFIDAEDVTNWIAVTIFFISMIGSYIYVLYRSNHIDSLKVKIRNNDVIISYGDILEIEEGVKVITFNQYFDTKADNVVLSKNTLNGKFINKYYQDDVEVLDKEIEVKLRNTPSEETNREIGKSKRFEPGTMIEVRDGYLLTAFAKYDEYNREYLPKTDYITYLMNFWESIDKSYKQRDVYVPLMGTGICRIDPNLKPQDYLEQLLNSLNLSGLDLAYDCEIYIVLSEHMKKYIDLYKVKNMYVKNQLL